MLAAAVLAACGGGDGSGTTADTRRDPLAVRDTGAPSKLQPAFGADKLPIGLTNEPYEADLAVDGGTKPYTYSLAAGGLPAGLQLDPKTGAITGRPARVGESLFTVAVRDRQGRVASRSFSILIDESTGSAYTAPGQPTQVQGGSTKPSKNGGATTPAGKVGSATTSLQSAAAAAAGPDLSNLITIIAGMGEGQWQKVNLNAYSAVWTPAELRPLIGKSNPTPASIILAWSSFAWDTRRGNLFLYGGGHANYRGNDTYLWRGSTQMWERGSLPSEMVATPLGYYNAIDGFDKAPASAHTYDNTLYLPIVDRMLVLGGAADPNGSQYYTQPTPTTKRITGPYLFDPSRAHPDKVGGTTGSHVQRVAPHPEVVGGEMWSNRESWLNASATSAPPSDILSNGCTGYAAEAGKDVVYVRSPYRLYRYEISDLANPATDRWSQVGRFGTSGSGDQSACAFDPERRLFVSTHIATTAPFLVWNLNVLSSTTTESRIVPVDPSGEFMTLISSGALKMRNCGFDFDPLRADYKLWCGDGRVWALTPPPPGSSGWTIVKAAAPTGAVPSESLGTGIIGKWKYIPNLDVFMGLLDATQGNIWIYKPVGWVNPLGGGNLPPSVTLTEPANGATYIEGAEIALAANAADGDGTVAKVEFFADGLKIGESLSAPYGTTWVGAGIGSHLLTAVATDDLGATKTSGVISITVNPLIIPNQPPSVNWTAPANNSSIVVGNAVTLEVAAADSDGAVTKVEFFDGVLKLGEVLAAPYQFVWTAPPQGGHSLTAVATDDDGSTTVSSVLTFNVTGLPGSSTTVTLQRDPAGSAVVRDTYLSTYHQTLNFGTAITAPDEYTRYSPLLRFGIFQSEGGPVPNGANITSAVLSLYKSTAYNMTYSLHRVQVDWSESGATWLNRLPGVPWSAPGANGMGTDLLATPDATATIGWDPGWLNLDVTAAVRAMSGSGNFGWRLLGTAGYVSGLKKYYTSEYTGAIELRPKLVITYE